MNGYAWAVIVEENLGSGESRQWKVSDTHPVDGDVHAARAMAENLARNHQPRHPMSPRDRTMYRIGEDCWLVVVPGATQTFHFRVSVAQRVF